MQDTMKAVGVGVDETASADDVRRLQTNRLAEVWDLARDSARAGIDPEHLHRVVADAVDWEAAPRQRVEDLMEQIARRQRVDGMQAATPAAAAGPMHPKERQQSALVNVHHVVHQALLLGVPEAKIDDAVREAVALARKNLRRDVLTAEVAEVLQRHGVTSSHDAVDELAFMFLEAEGSR